ncbi:MAG TPA: phosphoribosyltransferase family protein [Chthoniobacterales bacterium]
MAACQARGIVRDLILRFKYHRQEYLRRQLGEWLMETFQDERIKCKKPDAFVPVPLFHRRRRERGYNQAELLCEVLAEKTEIPILRALRRVRHTQTQTAFDRAERMENLRNAFQIRKGSNVRSLHLLLVDDVLTTGSTLDECARVLRNAGAASVRAICVARG